MLRPETIQQLKQSESALIEAINGTSTEEATWVPSDQSWSVLACCEHIWLVEKNITRLISKPLMPAADPSTKRVRPETISRLMQDRSQKYTVPENIGAIPTGRFESLAAFTEQFAQTRSELRATLEQSEWETDASVLPHPRLGPLTKSEWLHFLIEHTTRHIEQINEVRAAFHASR